MSIFRCFRSMFAHVPLAAVSLLMVTTVIVMNAATVAAQSSPDKSSSTQTLATDPNPQDHMRIDHLRVDQFRFQPGQLALPHSYFWSPRTEGDSVCYTMRSYLVVRDGPHSDTTHPAGYSTCQPSKKFEVRSTQQEVQPSR